MNQFSIKACSVADAMKQLDELLFHTYSWQINGKRGVEEVSLVFRTDLDQHDLETILDGYGRLDTLTQDF